MQLITLMGLTDGEKQAAKNQVDADATAAKDAANAAIDGALAEKNSAIDAASNLTDEEKQAVKKQAKTAADNAKTEINKATTVDEVESAKDTGADNINKVAVPTDSQVKNDAIDAIDKALKQKNAAINAAEYLTDEEKKSLTDQATTAANNAKTAINIADTNAAVVSAMDDGITNINNVTVPGESATKQAAKDAVKQAADTKIDKINSTSGLTSDEKDALIKQVNDIVAQTNNDIDDAPTNAAVETAKNTGIDNINKVTVPETSQAKQDAIKAIDDAAKAKGEAIKNAPSLTDEEKQSLIDQVNKKAEDAKDKINSATTDKGVADAKDTGVNDINKITVPETSKAKENAIKAIDEAAKAKKKVINNASNLTSDEKQDLIDQVNKAAEDAKKNISEATNNLDVEASKNEGLKKINSIEIPTDSKVKDTAIAEITAELNKKLDEINSNLVLVEEEKNTLIREANSAADKAKKAVRNATSDSDVENEKNAGITNIRNVNVPTESKAKQDAKAEIDAAAAVKKDEISKAPLTNDEAKKLNDLVDQEAASAKNAIDAAKTNAAVEDAKNDGVKSINSIKVPVRVVNIINYVDENGNIVKSDSLSGKLGDKISLNAPAGYHFKDSKTPNLVLTQDGVQTVNVVKDQHDTDTPEGNDKPVLNVINYVDENGNIVKSDSVSGELGDKISLNVPVGYHFKDGKTPNLVLTQSGIQAVNVVRDQYDTDTPEENNKPVLNIINYVDENGNVVKTDSVSGKLGDTVKVTLPAGYHFKDCKTPSLVLTQSGVQTVNVVKDQHDTDTPEGNDKPVLNIINYVDENGNVVKTDSVSGKLGDTVKVTLPAGYHFKAGKAPSLVITQSGVQIVNIVKDKVNPDIPTIDDNNKKNDTPTIDDTPVTPNPDVEIENSKTIPASTTPNVSNTTYKAVAKNSEQGQLPQTGNEDNAMSAAGLALAGLAGLFGLSSFKKKRD